LRSLLPEFAMACLEGGPPGHEWDALEAHLDACATCRTELDDLLQLLDATAAGMLAPEPEDELAPPALSEQLVAPEPASFVSVVHVAVASLRRTLIEFSDALHGAMRQPALGGGFRSQGPPLNGHRPGEPVPGLEPDTPPEEFRYELSAPSDDIAVAIDFALKDPGRQLYELKITVISPDRDPYSQDGHHVTLHYEAQTAEGVTNATGCVAFPGIPYDLLPQLQITITPHPPNE